MIAQHFCSRERLCVAARYVWLTVSENHGKYRANFPPPKMPQFMAAMEQDIPTGE